MDPESTLDTLCTKSGDHLADGILGFCNGHPVAWDDDNAFRAAEEIDDLIYIGPSDAKAFGRVVCCGGLSDPTEDDVDQGTIHCAALW